MLTIHAPHRPSPSPLSVPRPWVFLAGSIELGAAAPWQDEVEALLRERPGTLWNPRRPEWDASWEQRSTNPEFYAQVSWELDKLAAADRVLMHFDPKTRSPVTLLELGLTAATAPEKLIVSCPVEFWRRGNVEIVCERYGVALVERLADAVGLL